MKSEAKLARLCVIGASTTEGMGDTDRLGWVGHAVNGFPYTVGCFNLGIRGQTIFQIAERADTECRARVLGPDISRIVLGAALNEIARFAGHEGGLRFPRDEIYECYDQLVGLLNKIAPVLMIGPPPVRAEQMPFFSQMNQAWFEFRNEDIISLDNDLVEICTKHEVPYIPVFEYLSSDKAYMDGLAKLDGVHSDAAGYARLGRFIASQSAWKAHCLIGV